MNFRRPTQFPLWAWGAGATLVQPPSGAAEVGFDTEDQPPAQWFNWQFNTYGAWLTFLAGPDVEKWERVVWPGTPASDHFDAPSRIAFDVDVTTSDAGQTAAAFRYACVGDTSAPDAKMFVSQRGNDWEARASGMPSGVTGPYALKAIVSGRWLLGCLTSMGATAVYYGAADDGTAAGPMGAEGNTWSAASSLPGSPTEVKSFAQQRAAAKVVAACATEAMYSSDDGVNWSACTFTTSPSGNGRDVACDGSAYVWVSQDGEVFTSADGVTFVLSTTLAAGSGTWQLTAGAVGELLAWRIGSSTAVDIYRSTDSGVSWTAVTQPTGSPTRITSVAYREGVWVATGTRSPWAWVSNDATSWRALSLPTRSADATDIPPALYSVRWDGGRWVAIGNGLAMACGRAADPADGVYVAHDAPSTLSDAGSFRGRLLSTTAPTDGQVLVWVAATSKWTPSTPSAGSSLPTAGGADEFPLSTGAGTTYTARTPAAVRAVLNRRSITNMTTGAGWTTSTTGDATSAFGSSKLALATGGGTNPGIAQASNASALPDAFDVDFIVRLDVVTNDGGAGSDGQLLLRIGDATNWVGFVTKSNGTFEVNRSAGAALASGSSGISSGDRTGGNLWLMVSRRRTGLAFGYAVSSTTPPLPSEWTLLAVSSDLAALNLAKGTWAMIAAYVPATVAYGIDITAIRASAADGGEL